MRPRSRLAALSAGLLAALPVALTPVAAQAAPTDLLISEYVEGSGNSKAIEIYNGTGAPVDLSGYGLEFYFNGNATPGLTISLTGTVTGGDVFVVAQASAAAAVLAAADQTSTASWFNGDDAIVLTHNGSTVDSLGQVGVDPGAEWGSGLTSTADNTLRRLDTATAGDTNVSDPFDPAAEWAGFAQDTFDGLGSLTSGGGGPVDPPPTGELSVGAVQGTGARSPLAPASGNGTSAALYDVRGVITQRTLSRSSSGQLQYGFFLQSRRGTEDGDPASSDGLFVFMGSFTSLIGGYLPTTGDEVVLRGRVSEFFDSTQLSGTSLVRKIDSGVTDYAVTDAAPPADLAAARAYWETHEGEQVRARAGDGVSAARDVFASTADAEITVLDRDDELTKRADPYARRVFRDPHPLDNDPARFDDGNGNRILLGAWGVKYTANDSFALLPPARVYDTLAADAVGGVSYAFNKYAIQVGAVTFAAGADPAGNNPPKPANRSEELAISTDNVENLYDFRDDPFDDCDFADDAGCPGVSKPFDYVPASDAAYRTKLTNLADQVVNYLHGPDLISVEEAEDQDICTASGTALSCGDTNNADGSPDTLQELALAIAAAGGPKYQAAYDRTGADVRGITAAFMFRTDRVSLAPTGVTDPILGSAPTVRYRSAPLASNADIQNPKALNAELPADVDTSTGVDGTRVYTRAPQVGKFVVKAAPGSAEHYTLWAVANHFSSTPDARVGQRREQAAYGAAIVEAIEAADPGARIAYGGDLNVFPRPDDPIATAANPTPSDQLAPLYGAGLHNLWENLAAEAPAAAYSYVFDGQAQTLDHLFVNDPLYGDLVQVRSAHINADYPADFDGDGSRGSSDHDPQVARFRSRPSLAVSDVTVAEGDRGDTPMAFTVSLSRPSSQTVVVCAAAIGVTATIGADFAPFAGCRTIQPGATSTTFAVAIHGDRRHEPDERLTLLVAGVPGLRPADPTGVGTITDDD